jgi:AbiV family abortive infection protein
MIEKLAHNLRLCLDQAEDFIEAATRVEAAAYPHIVYHLGLLALEEVGKANMMGAMIATNRDEDADFFDKALNSHRRKLQWAIWSPAQRFDPADFEEACRFADNAHARRLASLYVDAKAELGEPPPRAVVSVEAATTILELARSRLELERLRVPADYDAIKADDLLLWFLETVADEFQMRHLFSPAFVDQYHAFGCDARVWIAWARDEFARLDREADEALQRELARVPASAGTSKPKWRLNATIYTPSHALRPKILQRWNDRMERVQLLWSGKKDQLTLQIQLNDNTTLDRLRDQANYIAKLAVASLNMGTIGYFWFERPGFELKMFNDIRDLESGHKLEIEPRVTFWGDHRPFALTDMHIDHALNCLLVYGSLSEQEAEAVIMPYYHGLALLSKSDAFHSFDYPAYKAFGASLAGALALFGGWDGKDESFLAVAEQAFTPIFRNEDERTIMLRHLKGEYDAADSAVDRIRCIKNLADLYLVHISYERAPTILNAAELALARGEAWPPPRPSSQ